MSDNVPLPTPPISTVPSGPPTQTTAEASGDIKINVGSRESPVYKTLSELVNQAQTPQGQSQQPVGMSQEEFEEAKMLLKAFRDNDPNAISTVWDRYSPKQSNNTTVQPTAPDPKDAEIVQLKQMINDLRTSVDRMAPVTQAMTKASTSKQLDSIIKQNATILPVLSKDPMGVTEIIRRVENLESGLIQESMRTGNPNIHPDNIPQAKKVQLVFDVIKETELEMQNRFKAMGYTIPSQQPTNPTPKITAVDDQISNVKGLSNPDRYKWENGKWVDKYTQPTVPSAHVPVPTGQTVGANPQANQSGKLTPGDMHAKMTARLKEISY